MIKLLNFSNIFFWIEKLINFISSIFFVFLLVALSFALIFSPPDYLQGDSVRIMYIHVPSAWISLASFTFIALLSILHFLFKIKNLKLVIKSIAPIGLMFTCLALVTGSIWGQPTWGTWWAWDARITSMSILALFYIVLILTYKFVSEEDKANKISSFIAILGLINIPIIKYSVEWWNTLHQPASISKFSSPSIDSSMLTPLIVMTFAILFFSLQVILIRIKSEIIQRKIDVMKSAEIS